MRVDARAEGLGCRNGCVHCERVKVRQCNAQLCTYMYGVLDGLWFVASVLVLKLFVYSHFTVVVFFARFECVCTSLFPVFVLLAFPLC